MPRHQRTASGGTPPTGSDRDFHLSEVVDEPRRAKSASLGNGRGGDRRSAKEGKFRRRYKARMHPEWKAEYVPYGRLRKAIKRLPLAGRPSAAAAPPSASGASLLSAGGGGGSGGSGVLDRLRSRLSFGGGAADASAGGDGNGGDGGGAADGVPPEAVAAVAADLHRAVADATLFYLMEQGRLAGGLRELLAHPDWADVVCCGAGDSDADDGLPPTNLADAATRLALLTADAHQLSLRALALLAFGRVNEKAAVKLGAKLAARVGWDPLAGGVSTRRPRGGGGGRRGGGEGRASAAGDSVDGRTGGGGGRGSAGHAADVVADAAAGHGVTAAAVAATGLAPAGLGAGRYAGVRALLGRLCLVLGELDAAAERLARSLNGAAMAVEAGVPNEVGYGATAVTLRSTDSGSGDALSTAAAADIMKRLDKASAANAKLVRRLGTAAAMMEEGTVSVARTLALQSGIEWASDDDDDGDTAGGKSDADDADGAGGGVGSSGDRASGVGTPLGSVGPPPPPESHFVLNLLSAFLYVVSMYVCAPTAGAYAAQLGASESLAGVIVGLTPFAGLFSSVAFSAASNGGTVKAPLLVASVSCLAGNALYAAAFTARSLPLVLVGRLLVGCGGARAINRRFISDFSARADRTRRSAAFVSVSALGMAAGPALASALSRAPEGVIGGFAFNRLTTPGWALVAVWAVFIAALAAVFRDRLPPPGSPGAVAAAAAAGGSAPPKQSVRAKLAIVVQQRGVLLCLWVYFIIKVAAELLVASAGTVTVAFGWGAGAVGAFLAALGLLMFPAAALGSVLLRAARYDDRRPLLWTLGVLGVGCVVIIPLPWVEGMYTSAQYVTAAVIIFVSSNLVEAHAMALLVDTMPTLLAGGTLNGGLLSTEAGMLGRAVGDLGVTLAGVGHRPDQAGTAAAASAERIMLLARAYVPLAAAIGLTVWAVAASFSLLGGDGDDEDEDTESEGEAVGSGQAMAGEGGERGGDLERGGREEGKTVSWKVSGAAA